ncbi:Gfo/Idh/MocA family oxidoreductase [Streptomyces sp. BE20]|uniref:Gfo/Idh/MocA family oxidoreductase n=1 Tax=Streptomyces sp. BE20 TaxID=3002525 RepID=UPI002E782058|nr:Gfo/Idh/MocA family oxidoreductase [Streptomyces sp. BE20]MEE1827737.1 Gfo/Idh/MocA family oxidoreductase [Streptomyces sp. BE20]
MRAVVLTGPGQCEVIERDEPPGGPGQVVVDLSVSVISPGTERAILLDLPNAGARYPEHPGYQAAGTVRSGSALPAGTRVAVRRARHAEVAVVPERHVRPIPDRVPPADAAVWQLALTALHGLETGGQRPGEPVTVVGGGLLGVITRRLAAARGASRVRAVAATTAKAWTLRAEPTTVRHEPGGPDDDGTPLVLDVTDSGTGLAVAIGAAAPGGRVVLLGSPRTERADIPLQQLHDRGIDLRGAHVGGLTEAEEDRLSDIFFDLLEQRRFTIRDVLSDYPAHRAPQVYRRLATDRAFISAALRWDAPRPATGRRAASARPLRYGLIGCGDIGIEDAKALAAADEAELTACHDPFAELAEETAARFGGQHTPDVAALLARDDVDAVIVATPHDTHEQLFSAALAAGKHVLLEKPVAQDLATARRMAELADSAGPLRTGVLFPTRTDPRFGQARAAIAAGEIGEPLGVTATYFTDKPAGYFQGGLSGRAPSNWRLDRDRAGGGFLIMNLIHQVDTVRALLGREADRVYAETAPSSTADAEGIEDAVTLVLRFGPIVATLIGSASVVGGTGMRTSVWGEKGEVALTPDFRLTHRAPLGAAPPAGRPAPTAIDLRTTAFTRFALAVRDGTPVDVSLSDGLRTQAVVEAGYAAAWLGRAIDPARLLAGGTP